MSSPQIFERVDYFDPVVLDWNGLFCRRGSVGDPCTIKHFGSSVAGFVTSTADGLITGARFNLKDGISLGIYNPCGKELNDATTTRL